MLQKKFWNVYENNMEKLYLQKNPNDPYVIIEWAKIRHDPKVKAKFSANFLRNNQDWI